MKRYNTEKLTDAISLANAKDGGINMSRAGLKSTVCIRYGTASTTPDLTPALPGEAHEAYSLWKCVSMSARTQPRRVLICFTLAGLCLKLSRWTNISYFRQTSSR